MDWHHIGATSHAQLYLWLACVTLGVIAESVGIVRGRHYVTFTTLVKYGAPRWLVAAILGWLTWHFLIQP